MSAMAIGCLVIALEMTPKKLFLNKINTINKSQHECVTIGVIEKFLSLLQWEEG